MQAAPYGVRTKAPGGVASRLFEARFEADNLSTREALADIRVALERDGFGIGLIGRVEIALAELFNNIAEHAYRSTGMGEVRCTMGVNDTNMIVEVTDQGGPMPGGEIPEGTLPDVDVAIDDLPEGGFGWFLIRNQADDLTHQRLALGNCTRLTFQINRNGAA